MTFDITTIIRTIKDATGFFYLHQEILNYSYDCIIKEKFLFNNRRNHLKWDKFRISNILNGREHLYKSLTKTIEMKDTKSILMNHANEIYENLFDEVDGDAIVDELIECLKTDSKAPIELIAIVDSSDVSYPHKYCELLYYCLEVDYERNKFALSTLNTNEKINQMKSSTNISIIGKMILNITMNQREKNEVKIHTKAWTLEDKIKKNKISKAIKELIDGAFVFYDFVIDALENLKIDNYMIDQTLYSYYKNVYQEVLIETIGFDYTDEDIIKKSSEIFYLVNKKIYDRVFKNVLIEDNLTIEEIENNLLAITTAVFYQCKFLLSVEE